MEGNQLAFFVTYKNHQALITLSEYDTIEQLKMEIDNNFNIPVMDQVIDGWHSIPENDDMILQLCSKPINVNCLVVTNTKEKNSKEIEIEVTKRLKEKLPDIPLKVQYVSFQDAVANIASRFEKRALLLYLHNSKDVFSQNFLGYAYDDDIADILEKNFLVLGWDIEDQCYHEALLSALKPFGSLSIISYLITKKNSAAICLLVDGNQPVLFSCLRGDLSYQNVLETLRELQVQLNPGETIHENDSPMEEQDELSKKIEIEATRSLKDQLSSIPFKVQHLSLQDAVSNIVSSLEKKALLLYLHNSQDVFTQNFLSYVHDHVIANILEKSFLIVGWDIEDTKYHEALLSALKPFQTLSILSHLITEKKSAAICLLVDGNQPVLFSCLRGDLTYQNVLEAMKNIQGQLNLSETIHDNYSAMREQDELSKKYEIEAIGSLKRKLPPNTSIAFRYCTLDDAISFICTSPFDERKALLLYLHNSEHPFSTMFSGNLGSGEMVQILNRSFLVLGWDLEEPKYHNALVSALSRHVNLSIVADLVTSKVSVALCILPISGTISVYLCLRGKMSLKESVKSLKEVEKVFREEIVKEKELQSLESEKSSENDLGSERLHSIWADMLGDRDYDSFEHDQHSYLKDKIGFALKGPPQKESGYDLKIKEQIEEIYEVIKTESNEIAEFKDKVEISFIFNCLEPLPEEKVKRGKKFNDYNPQTDVNPVPVFVLRKCRGSDNPCRIFIDDTGRVYQNWSGYLTKNKFPECEMIVPLNGRYQVIDDKVLLEKHLSPACHLDTKFLQVGDIVSTAAGLAAGAVFITAAIPAIPVAAPLLIAAGVVGASAGIWAIGRSAYTLIDRKIHKESMSFANSEARGAYINIVAGSLGFVGAGANMALTQLVKSGANIGQGATYLVNTVGILNISAGGASLVNSGYEVFDQWYNENQTPSALTILQLGTSVLFFGHAVYNFKGAQTIIDETQARVLKDYNDSLRSNRHRKTFNKLMKETLRTHGDGARGRAEVISAIRNIQNKDEVFAALTRNNKALNRAGIRFSAEGGQIKLGGIAVDMSEFIGLNKKQTETFLGSLSQQKPSQQPMSDNTTTTTTSSNIPLKTAINDILSDIKIDTSGANLQQLIALTSEILMFCSGDVKTKVINAIHETIRYVMGKLAKSIAQEIDTIIPKNAQYFEFLQLGISFFSRKVDEWEQKYQKYERTKNPIYYDPLFEHINPLYAKRTISFFDFVVRNSYSGETLIRAVLAEFSRYITAWITRVIFENEEKKECEQRRKRHSAGFKVKIVNCSDCGGYYFKHV